MSYTNFLSGSRIPSAGRTALVQSPDCVQFDHHFQGLRFFGFIPLIVITVHLEPVHTALNYGEMVALLCVIKNKVLIVELPLFED